MAAPAWIEQEYPGYNFARKAEKNVWKIYFQDDRVVTRYYETDIVISYPNGTKILNSGGYHTAATKKKIEKYGEVKLTSRILRNRGADGRVGKTTVWVLPTGQIFFDGIIWTPEGVNAEIIYDHIDDNGLGIEDEEFDHQAMHGEGFDMGDPDVRAALGIVEEPPQQVFRRREDALAEIERLRVLAREIEEYPEPEDMEPEEPEPEEEEFADYLRRVARFTPPHNPHGAGNPPIEFHEEIERAGGAFYTPDQAPMVWEKVMREANDRARAAERQLKSKPKRKHVWRPGDTYEYSSE